ncbi:MAG TPA: hypothetical protein VFR28_05630, partial [Allosphingosinicella sp.]|nr:hypothetical protein [Allosphingosinicella sp.]
MPEASDSAPGEKSHGTGLFYRDGREIRPTHPDHGPMHLLPRQENGSFSAYYYFSKAELFDMEIHKPPPRRYRRDGFSEERQEQFLEYVRGGASGREAARMVGRSPTTAYNLYNSPDGAAFKAGWDEAAKVADIVLEDTAFDRAVNGQEEIVYHQGQRVGVRWKYDNKLLMQLLRARNPLKYAPLSEIEGWLKTRGIAPPADVDGAIDRLLEAEEEWGRRLPGEDPPPPSIAPPLRASLEPQPAAERIEAAGQSTSSTSPGSAAAEDAPVQSTSSTLPAGAQAEDLLDQSTSSTLLRSAEAEDAARQSTSSTSPVNGQAVLRSADGSPAPDGEEGPSR